MNVYMTKQKIQLLIFAWGASYENKLNLTVSSFMNDLKSLKKKVNVSLLFFTDNDLESLLKKKLFIELSNYKIEFKVYDISNRLGEKDFFNKIQEYAFSISRDLKSDIILPIYSDFIFFDNSLINVIDILTKDEKKIIFQPILCLIEEKVYSKISKILKSKKVLHQKSCLPSIISKNNIHNIQKMMIINDNEVCLSPAWNIYIAKNDDIYISTFHNSPIGFRTELLPEKIEIKISIDEDFANKLFDNLNYYSECCFIKDSKESLIISLKSIEDKPTKINDLKGKQKKKKDMSAAQNWIQKFTNNFHKYSSNFVYFINHKSRKKNEKAINHLNELNDKLLD
jgi:hypothetical protein